MPMRSQFVPLVVAVAAGFAGGMFSQQLIRPVQAAGGPGVVTTRDLRLVDANGKLLAELAPVRYPAQKTPHTELTFFDANGYRETFGTAGLYIGRGYGNENIGVGYSYGSSGKLSPSIFFWFNKKGRMGLMLDADKSGAPSAFMYDAKGNTVWRAPAPAANP